MIDKKAGYDALLIVTSMAYHELNAVLATLPKLCEANAVPYVVAFEPRNPWASYAHYHDKWVHKEVADQNRRVFVCLPRRQILARLAEYVK